MIERRRECVLALRRGCDANGEIWVEDGVSLDTYIVETRQSNPADAFFYGTPLWDLLNDLPQELLTRPNLALLTPDEITEVGMWRRQYAEPDDSFPPHLTAKILNATEGNKLHCVLQAYAWNDYPAYKEYIRCLRHIQYVTKLPPWKWGTKTYSTKIGQRMGQIAGNDASCAADELRETAMRIDAIDRHSLNLPDLPSFGQWLIHPGKSRKTSRARSRENHDNIVGLQNLLKEEGVPALYAYGQFRRQKR